jgi:hypothetical protein
VVPVKDFTDAISSPARRDRALGLARDARHDASRRHGYSRLVDGVGTAGALEEVVREHAALRRVATLVAREPSRAEVFAVVTQELGELLGAQRTTLLRVESPEWAVVDAGWSASAAPPVPAGHRGAIDGRGILGRMLRVAAPVRIEDFDEVGGEVAALMRELGIRSADAGPIILGGRVWGALTATWPEGLPMPVGAEDRVVALPSWSRRRSRTPRRATSWPRRVRGSFRRPTRCGGGSSAICTTARSSASLPRCSS